MDRGQIAEYLRAVALACDDSMKKVGPRSARSRVANTWWNEQLRILRLEAGRARRRMLRVKNRNTENFISRQTEYRAAKRVLNRNILKAKVDTWETFCTELMKDP